MKLLHMTQSVSTLCRKINFMIKDWESERGMERGRHTHTEKGRETEGERERERERERGFII